MVVQVMKTEAAIYSASGGTMRPAFTQLNNGLSHDPDEAAQERERQRSAADKAARQQRLERA